MSDFATVTDRNTVMFVRQLPGPITRVWSYLTDPAFLAKWFSEGVVGDSIGGEVRFDMGVTGRVTNIDPPHILEYTWNAPDRSQGPIADTLVRWELAEVGTGVRLTLTHSRLPLNEIVTHSAGWHTFFHRLAACIDGRAPEPIDDLYDRFKAEYDKRDSHVS